VKIAACLTSKSMHYCTGPEIIIPARRLLVPAGSGRTLIDPWTNGASQVGADYIADGIDADGHKIRWTVADTSLENPPYGDEILDCIQTSHHWHVEVGMPGVWLGPSRTDTIWMQGGTKAGIRYVGIHESADAWIEVQGRLTFWCPIPIAEKDAPDPEKGARYYLRRFFPKATDDNLPAPFRLLEPGVAVGPELGKNGKPQCAPFPSIVAFWADRVGRYGRREDEAEHPIDLREFSRHFGRLGTLYVRTGPNNGVYPRRRG